MTNIVYVVFVSVLMAFDQARAGSIVWFGTVGFGQVEQSNGDLAPVNSAVRLGIFDSDFDFQNLRTLSFNTYSEVEGNGWTEWGSRQMFMPGVFSDTFFTDATHVGQFYIWTFNHSDPNRASQWGIVTDPSWISPSNSMAQILVDTGGVANPTGYIWGSAGDTSAGGEPNLRMASRFLLQIKILQWEPTMSHTILTMWSTNPGDRYQIEEGRGLAATQNWTHIGNAITADSTQMSDVIMLSPIEGEDASFYRIRRLE